MTDSLPSFGGPAPESEVRSRTGQRWNLADWRPGRRDVVAGLAAMVTAAVVGAPLGWIWAHTARRVDVQAALSDSESAFTRQTSIDLWFALLSLIAGLLIGLLVWWLSRPADWPVPLGLAVGATGGALIAGAVGRAVNSGIPGLPHDATDLAKVLLRFHVRAPGWYVVYPAVALIVLLIAMSFDPDQPTPAPEPVGNPTGDPSVEPPRAPTREPEPQEPIAPSEASSD